MKTIVIYEGGQEHVLTAAKLRTPLQSGGTCDWVPEDETDLVTKYVSENGTYNASSDNAYGYSFVTVNVPGGDGSSNSIGEPSGIGVTETKPGGGLDLDDITPPGGIGSSIVGTDPETGNDVVVGVDEDGNLVNTPVPSAISIITPPTKTEYIEGETIDYSGMVVELKKKDGTTFTDARYMNGHIPMQELIFPVKVAPAASGSGGYSYHGDLPLVNQLFDQPVYAASTLVFKGVIDDYWDGYLDCTTVITTGNGGLLVPYTRPDGTRGILAYTTNSDNTIHEISTCPAKPSHDFDYEKTYGSQTYYTIASGTAFWNQISTNGDGTPQQPSNIAKVQLSTSDRLDQELGTLLFDGDYTGGTATIPVKWTNPYTGATHQDTFEITSTSASGDAHTSTGSSGTEGSGGGGTF